VVKVTLTMCEYNEPKATFKTSLKSLVNQPYDEFIIATCSKLPIDVNYDICWETKDGSVVCSGNKNKIKTVCTTLGKLHARNVINDMATGDIIIATDSDTVYPRDFIESIVKYFNNERVVAVETVGDIPLRGIPSIISSRVRLSGRGSAFRKKVWEMISHFDENVDRTDPLIMMQEEELLFYERLATFGKVVFSNIVTHSICEPVKKKRGLRVSALK